MSDKKEEFKTNILGFLDDLHAKTQDKSISWKPADKSTLEPTVLVTNIGNHAIAVIKKVSSRLFLKPKEHYKVLYYTGSNFSLENEKQTKTLPLKNETAKALFDMAFYSFNEDYVETTNEDVLKIRKSLNNES